MGLEPHRYVLIRYTKVSNETCDGFCESLLLNDSRKSFWEPLNRVSCLTEKVGITLNNNRVTCLAFVDIKSKVLSQYGLLKLKRNFKFDVNKS